MKPSILLAILFVFLSMAATANAQEQEKAPAPVPPTATDQTPIPPPPPPADSTNIAPLSVPDAWNSFVPNPSVQTLIPSVTLRTGGGYASGLFDKGRTWSEGFGLVEGEFTLHFRVSETNFLIAPFVAAGAGGNDGMNRWDSEAGIMFLGETHYLRGGAGVEGFSYNNLGKRRMGYWLAGGGAKAQLNVKWDPVSRWSYSGSGVIGPAVNSNGHIEVFIKVMPIGLTYDF